MTGAVSSIRNRVFVESGRRGARARWGPERIVRLDELDERIRAAVVALVQADRAARSAIAEPPSEPEP
jgi:hypothetical protein